MSREPPASCNAHPPHPKVEPNPVPWSQSADASQWLKLPPPQPSSMLEQDREGTGRTLNQELPEDLSRGAGGDLRGKGQENSQGPGFSSPAWSPSRGSLPRGGHQPMGVQHMTHPKAHQQMLARHTHAPSNLQPHVACGRAALVQVGLSPVLWVLGAREPRAKPCSLKGPSATMGPQPEHPQLPGPPQARACPALPPDLTTQSIPFHRASHSDPGPALPDPLTGHWALSGP